VVKLVYCFRRKPGLTREEFSRYWSDIHGPIGAGIRDSGGSFRAMRWRCLATAAPPISTVWPSSGSTMWGGTNDSVTGGEGNQSPMPNRAAAPRLRPPTRSNASCAAR
jgi:hypothetical protein